MSNYFKDLNSINVSEKIEKKGNLSYLSWAFAWEELKKAHPAATSKVYETEQGIPYWNDGKTAWVKASVIIDDIEHIEYLPIMDFKNKSVPLDNVTSTDVNKAIQRCITKAIARHGLGLYIYAGEDLPEDEKEQDKKERENAIKKQQDILDYVIAKMNELVEFHGSRENVYALLNLTEKEFLNLYKSNTSKLASIIKQFLTPSTRANQDKIIENKEIDPSKVSEVIINEPK